MTSHDLPSPLAQRPCLYQKLHDLPCKADTTPTYGGHHSFALAQRPCLYQKLGVKGVGSKASEKEIRAAYKRAALECHPDKMRESAEAERVASEAKFKELGEALDILTDEFKRKLWDEGHDLDAIAQRVQMREQQQGRR